MQKVLENLFDFVIARNGGHLCPSDEAIQKYMPEQNSGLPRRFAPRNDGLQYLFLKSVFFVWLTFIILFSYSALAGDNFTIPNAKTIYIQDNDKNIASLYGRFIQGGLVFGKINQDLKVQEVYLDDKKIKLNKGNSFVFGFLRKAPKEMILNIKMQDGKEFHKKLAIEQREYEIQRIDGLPDDKVTPPKEVWDWIQKDRELVKQARAKYIDEPYYLSGFEAPVKGIITGVYGSQRILNGKPKWPHYGVDIAAPAGTLVYAPADGVVTLANENMYYTGKTLIIDHGHNLSSTFLHLQKILVLPGQKIKKGEVIGKVGSTGRSTGPHLDWRMNAADVRTDVSLLVVPMK